MKLTDIHIRDPFIFAEDGTYYLYGTRANHPLGPRQGEGLDVYTSKDLEDWTEPYECFTRPENFWGTMNFFAPEVHKWKGKYYMFASFKGETHVCASQTLVADSPMGPFLPVEEEATTPAGWSCVDGTLFVDDDGKPWMVFCHNWTQIDDGTIDAIPLSDDLGHAIGEPILLFPASAAKWVFSLKSEDGYYVTDGCFFHRLPNGKLIMLWSSFAKGTGYAQSYAVSESGTLKGPWKQEETPFYTKDGGHGMLFKAFDGKLKLVMHQPNGDPYERPRIFDIIETEDGIKIAE